MSVNLYYLYPNPTLSSGSPEEIEALEARDALRRDTSELREQFFAEKSLLSLVPSNIFESQIISQVDVAALCALRRACTTLRTIMDTLPLCVERHIVLQTFALGKRVWDQHLGMIGEEPLLPLHILSVLKSPDSYDPSKTHSVFQTCVPFLIPKNVNGRDYTLNLLTNLTQEKISITMIPLIKAQLGQMHDSGESYWVLRRRRGIDGGNSDLQQRQALQAGDSRGTPLEILTCECLYYLEFNKYFSFEQNLILEYEEAPARNPFYVASACSVRDHIDRTWKVYVRHDSEVDGFVVSHVNSCVHLRIWPHAITPLQRFLPIED